MVYRSSGQLSVILFGVWDVGNSRYRFHEESNQELEGNLDGYVSSICDPSSLGLFSGPIS